MTVKRSLAAIRAEAASMRRNQWRYHHSKAREGVVQKIKGIDVVVKCVLRCAGAKLSGYATYCKVGMVGKQFRTDFAKNIISTREEKDLRLKIVTLKFTVVRLPCIHYLAPFPYLIQKKHLPTTHYALNAYIKF